MRPQMPNMAFDYLRLCRRNIHEIVRKRRPDSEECRACSMSQAAVNVFASRVQATALHIIHLPGARVPMIFDPVQAWHLPSFSQLSMSHRPINGRSLPGIAHTLDALRVRAQHPAMEDRMAALSHDDEAGLNGVCPVNDLLRGMAEDDIHFEFNVLLLGAFA